MIDVCTPAGIDEITDVGIECYHSPRWSLTERLFESKIQVGDRFQENVGEKSSVLGLDRCRVEEPYHFLAEHWPITDELNQRVGQRDSALCG
jgi:hypothetical protein